MVSTLTRQKVKGIKSVKNVIMEKKIVLIVNDTLTKVIDVILKKRKLKIKDEHGLKNCSVRPI